MTSVENKKPFRVLIPLLISQTIGAFNDNGMKAMLPLMAAYQFSKDKMDETNQIVSVLLILPFVVFAPLAGWVSDRYSKKKVVSYALLGQIVGLGTLIYAMNSQSLSLAFVGFLLLAIQSAFFSPGKKGILKELVGSERLGMAVGWMEMLTMVGILGGAFIAASYFDCLAPIHGGWKAGLILSIIAICLAIFSWLLFLPTVATEAPKAKPFQISIVWGYWNDLKFLMKDRGLRGAALGDAWFWAVGGFFYLVLVKLSGEVVVGKVGMGSLYGYWFLLLGLGIMSGSLFVAYLNRGRVEIGLTGIGAILLPFSLVILHYVDPLGSIFSYGSLLVGFSGALFFVPLNGFLQDRAKESERGRVLASSNLLTQLLSIVFIAIHALLSSLGFTAKEELLIMAIPASLIAVISMKFLFEDFLRAWFHIVLKFFYRIKIAGIENLPQSNGVLLVSNHLSYADPIFIGAAFPRKVRYLAYRGLAHSKIMRMVFRLTETETVSSEKSLDSLKACVKKVKAGVPLCVFAEGGISRTGSLFPFKRGIVLLAKQGNVPILPVHIDRVWGSIFSMERGRFFRKIPISFPYPVTVRAGNLIESKKSDLESVRSAVLELGRQSFSERIPSSKHAKRKLESFLKKRSQKEFLRYTDQTVLTRRDFIDILENKGNWLNIPTTLETWINRMRRVIEEPDGARRILGSSCRFREVHLWDQSGFEVNLDGNLQPEWILWAALVGDRSVASSGESIIVYQDMSKNEEILQRLNGLSSFKNGLISLNFKSLIEMKGEFDELENGFKKNTLGRLLPGLAYSDEPAYGLVGIDGEIDLIEQLGGIDDEGLLLPS